MGAWTKAEISIVKRYFPKGEPNACRKPLKYKRSFNAIYMRAQALGLTGSHAKPVRHTPWFAAYREQRAE